MPLRACLAVLSLASLTACAQFPDLDAALSPGAKRAAYPDLVPVEQIKARIPQTQLTSDQGDAISARVAALRARAQGLRGTVIDSPTRARMQTGVPQI